MKNTNRFILDYDTTLEMETKILIVEKVSASMLCPNGDSAQFCLVDVLDFFSFASSHSSGIDFISDDYDYLKELETEGVDYIEICF